MSIAVWGIAVGIIVMNDSYGIGDFKAWAFEDSTWVRPKPVYLGELSPGQNAICVKILA